MPESGGSRSVRRALEIFELMRKRGGPVVMTEITGTLGIPKSTAYDLVNTLTQTGYLAPAGRNGGWFLGHKLFELGMAYRAQVDLLKDGAEIVEALRDMTGETVQLSVLDGPWMLVLLKEEGVKPLRIISQVGSRVPVNWAAAGRLLVSDFDDGRLKKFLKDTARQSPSGKANTDIASLVSEIRRFRKRGYAIEINEANEHAGCVSAPVIDGSGQCIAAISIAAPEQRLAKGNREKLIAAVRAAAARLSRRMGG
ncbi:MAG TPA: IclR family transcriptional regulator [Candidatus Cybelea sp.]|nr:IclR family transcriptional regulator [Candidatus Cybelea sp.]